jgi:hypothetical protein
MIGYSVLAIVLILFFVVHLLCSSVCDIFYTIYKNCRSRVMCKDSIACNQVIITEIFSFLFLMRKCDFLNFYHSKFSFSLLKKVLLRRNHRNWDKYMWGWVRDLISHKQYDFFVWHYLFSQIFDSFRWKLCIFQIEQDKFLAFFLYLCYPDSIFYQSPFFKYASINRSWFLLCIWKIRTYYSFLLFEK